MIPYCRVLSFCEHMMKEALLVRIEIIKASAIPARQAMKARLIQAN